MKRDQKATIIQSLTDAFAANGTYYLVDFKKMKVSQTVELRKLLRKSAYGYRVVKNRLALRALGERCPADLKPLFRKPTGLAFAEKDPIGLAKLLKDYSAGGKVLAVKAGVIEGRYFPGERFDEICKLASRDALLGKIAYLLAYEPVRFLRTLRAPLQNLGLALGQLKQRKEQTN
jgi:large subunit ribosomal protein L10